MQMVKNIGPTQTFILISLQCRIASQTQKEKPVETETPYIKLFCNIDGLNLGPVNKLCIL